MYIDAQHTRTIMPVHVHEADTLAVHQCKQKPFEPPSLDASSMNSTAQVCSVSVPYD